MTATTDGRRALRLAALELRAAADDLDHRAGLVDVAAPFGAVLAGCLAMERAGLALGSYWRAISNLYAGSTVRDRHAVGVVGVLESTSAALTRKVRDAMREVRGEA